ncbi:MAG: zinc-finger domain-containing protein [Rhizobiales bacterium]|nr:zinc-finger domain-containing protein [Hyphomicrobiales bacterium]
MATATVPYFKNDIGVKMIEIGAHEFKCAGASPPFDHPHVFLDMGDDSEITCPYCSTLYRHRADLSADAAEPAECAYVEGSTD